jgi:hypothetical protein
MATIVAMMLLPVATASVIVLQAPAADATPIWQVGAPFTNALTSVAQGSLGTVGGDGRVYFVGGGWQGAAVPTLCSNGRNFYAVAAYDPGSNHWSFVAPLQTPRNRATAVTGGDGRVYAIGGQEPSTPCNVAVNAVSSVEAYSPATNSWTYVAPMLVARQFAGATTGTDGRIYVFGGRDGTGSLLSDDEVYDPTANVWTEIAPMPEPRAQTAVAADRQGRIYLFGGDNGTGGSATVERYTPATNTWDSTVAADPAGGTLAGTGVRGPDGRIYLIGMGFRSAPPPWTGTNIMIYDPATDAWSNSPQLAFATGNANPSGWMAGAGANGTIYAVGPANLGGSWQDTVQWLPPAVQTSSTTISASTSSVVYGQAVSATATVSGTDGGGTVNFYDGSSPILACQSVALTLVSATYQAQCSAPSLAAGSHAISASYSGDPLSTASASSPATVTVSAAPLVVTATSGTMPYGGTPPTVTPLVSGFQLGDGVSALGAGLACSTAASSSSPVGSYPSSCAGAVDANYSITYLAGTVSVGPAELTIVASSATRAYGDPQAVITPSYTGFVNGDGAASLTTLPTCATTATQSSPVGSYASSCSGAVDPNYDIGYVAGQVRVGPAPLMITAPSGTMTYGGSVPSLDPSYDGFVNGDGPASLTAPPMCTTTASSTSPVGTYGTTCAGASDPNYTINYTAGAVVVGPRPLVISASSASMTYGDNPPAVMPSYAGFVNGDRAATLSTQPTCSTTAGPSSPVGSFSTTCTGASDPNYAISYVKGAVDIAPAPLSIAASSASTTYGTTPPAITPSYTGFVNGDNATSLTTQPSCTTSATGSSPVGSYPAVCTGAVAANYTISYVPGVVDVEQAPLVITAAPASMVYGGPAPLISPIVTGLQNGEATSVLGAGLSCFSTATDLSSVGSYPSRCSGAVDGNYVISYAAGNVVVGPAPLSITASSASMVYGAAPPTITPIVKGLKNGDGLSALGPIGCSTTATPSSPVGTYDSSCTGASDANYTISLIHGTVTVVPTALVISASSGGMVYGGTVPAVSPSYSGFVNGDSPNSLTTQPTCTTSATSSSSVGTYPTMCQGASDANYDIGYVTGSISILAAPLTITASSTTATYGGAVPAVTPSYSPFVNGEGPFVLGPGITCSTPATSASPAGTYPSSCSGALGPNYAISYVSGTVSVLPSTLTVTADNQTMSFGSPVPPLMATMTGFVNGQTPATSDVTGHPSCTTTATASSPAGTYRITCSTGTLASADYQFVFAPGTLTVTDSVTPVCNVTGKLTIGSGQVRVGPGCWFNGQIAVSGGGSLDIEGATIRGGITFTGSGTLRICGSHLIGNLTIQAATGSVVLGDGSSSCPSDTIDGRVLVVSNAAAVRLRGAKVHGFVAIENNKGGVTVTNNVVWGRLILRHNAAPVIDRGNRVWANPEHHGPYAAN